MSDTKLLVFTLEVSFTPSDCRHKPYVGWQNGHTTNSACSGGSRISSRRGHQPFQRVPTYNCAKFFQKLHEIERIWIPGGRPKCYYVDPPLACHSAHQKRSKVPPVNVMVAVTESFGVNRPSALDEETNS